MSENKIVFKGKELELNTLEGTVGPSVLDIRSLSTSIANTLRVSSRIRKV